MINDLHVTKNDTPFDVDELRIAGNQITAKVNVLRFTDAETGQKIIYSPAFDISGYGETDEKADEIALFSFKEIFKHLVSLSTKKREDELRLMGWKINSLRRKQFSRAFFDVSGELQQFNAKDSRVERLTFQAA